MTIHLLLVPDIFTTHKKITWDLITYGYVKYDDNSPTYNVMYCRISLQFMILAPEVDGSFHQTENILSRANPYFQGTLKNVQDFQVD